jgi:PAS domain S-box-containing protein
MPPQNQAGTERMPINQSNCYAYNRAIIDLLPGAFCILSLDKKIRFVNEKGLEILGHHSAMDCIGKNLLEFIAPENKEEVTEGLRRTLLKRVGSFSEYIIQRPDGTKIPMFAASSLAVDEFGAPIGFVCVGHNRNEQNKTMVSRNLVSNRALFYLDIMSHDISNQLQVIMCATELLHNELKNTEHEHLLLDILDGVNRCNRVIESSEVMEQIISGETKIRSLRESIHIALMKIIEEEDVDILASLEIDDSYIVADEFLDQLIFAILDNACTHNDRAHKMIWVNTAETDSGYSVTISDNGPGIPDYMKQNLMETEKRKGGLGLHLCKLISDKYGAKISICDRVKKSPELGTQVELWFPKPESR